MTCGNISGTILPSAECKGQLDACYQCALENAFAWVLPPTPPGPSAAGDLGPVRWGKANHLLAATIKAAHFSYDHTHTLVGTV
jgi:hypothetical protein